MKMFLVDNLIVIVDCKKFEIGMVIVRNCFGLKYACAVFHLSVYLSRYLACMHICICLARSRVYYPYNAIEINYFLFV